MAQQSGDNDPNRPYIIIDGKPVYVDQMGQSGFDTPVQTQAKRRGLGCWIIGILFPIAIIGIVLMAVFSAFSGAVGQIPNLGEIGNVISTAVSLTSRPETKPIAGDPTHFDPLVGLDEARTFAGDGAQLVSIVASYVRSDGTMDLNATYSPAPSTEYKFLREVPRPENAPPVGAGGTKGGKWYEPITIEVYEPGQTRHVTSFGGNISSEYTYTNQGMEKNVDDPTSNPSDDIVADPTCSFTDMWNEALKKDAPADAVAVIEYNSDGYEFNIVGTLVLRFDENCNVIK
jgi:hypothetical protein